MIRRISTKLLIAVLLAVIVPFVGFAVFVERQMAERLSREVVIDSLKGLATDLASQIDNDLAEHVTQLEFLSIDRDAEDAIGELGNEIAGRSSERTNRLVQGERLDESKFAWPEYDLIVLVDAAGRFVVSSNYDSHDHLLAESVWKSLQARDWSKESWFAEALSGRTALIDQRASRYLPPQIDAPGIHAENFEFGFAVPVRAKDPLGRESAGPSDEPHPPIGVLVGLLNWKHVQDQVRQPVLKKYFQGLVGPDGKSSAYAWIWRADGDSIIAHQDESLYGKSVSRDLKLPELTEATQRSDGGLYPPYDFEGVHKTAAFKRCANGEHGGFGWVIGVGINDADIYAGARELRATLIEATAFVVLVAVLLTMVIARRTTAPILALQEQTRRVASGDLDTRVDVKSDDELGELGHAFNTMTHELKENRDKLVRAEKDAAWREMARQVAHDIKNPLTPIQLSVDLLKRAKREGAADFDAIFARTTDTISRQVAHLREISSDFHALTGSENAKPAPVELAKLMDEVLELHAAWARELGVAIERRGDGASVFVDPSLLRRVLINVVSNALQAMPHGGKLAVTIEKRGSRAAIELQDTGIGISKEAREHLFEPYFTTRSAGTGLGLAIAKRVVEEMGGTIALDNNSPPPGTTAKIELPLHAPKSA